MQQARKSYRKFIKWPSGRLDDHLSGRNRTKRTHLKATRQKELVLENRKLTWEAVDFAIMRKWRRLSVSGWGCKCPISTETEFLNSCQVG